MNVVRYLGFQPNLTPEFYEDKSMRYFVYLSTQLTIPWCSIQRCFPVVSVCSCTVWWCCVNTHQVQSRFGNNFGMELQLCIHLVQPPFHCACKYRGTQTGLFGVTNLFPTADFHSSHSSAVVALNHNVSMLNYGNYFRSNVSCSVTQQQEWFVHCIYSI